MISGLVLAAGTSSRLGTPKQLLDFRGQPLLQHVVDAACAARLDEVVVVLGHEADRIEAALRLPERARAVRNVDFAFGQATSLRFGLEALDPRSEAVVILLGDQPHMAVGLIDSILDARGSSGAPVVRARYEGAPGHPVLVARSEWAALGGVEGDRGARDLLEAMGGAVLDVDMGRPPLLDVDTWEQYRRLTGER
ncbi:MAG: nucleotidyltransferase family protein [Actinomycetota bacterium]